MPKKRKDRKPDRPETHEWKCKCGASGKVADKRDVKPALMMHTLMVHS